ncbi:hypothetical protein MCOL2_05513 [Listeria fleischmannii FSL S10-1203]|uniref:Uncharacterized protein n=1 Tax=Listeria fleischmannii FSL S10-1203 TaxID=1265822 RepID=W7DQG8_9LIST|nr:hypothetical protein MCOL2_05513 [Listeria fleischmannii FSL S10-1203]
MDLSGSAGNFLKIKNIDHRNCGTKVLLPERIRRRFMMIKLAHLYTDRALITIIAQLENYLNYYSHALLKNKRYSIL